jgi:hypothetical protein
MQNNNLEVFLGNIKEQQPDFEHDPESIENDALAGSNIYSNLGIKVLSVIGGLLGTLFFMGFIAAAIFDSPFGSIIFGSIFIVLAVILSKTSKSVLTDTSLLCLYIVGMVILGFGLERKTGDNTLAGTLFLISLLAIWLSRGFVMQFVSALIANGSLFSFLLINDAPNLYHVYFAYVVLAFIVFTHNEADIIASGEKINRLYSPLRSAYLFSLIAVLAFSNLDFGGQKVEYKWISSVLSITAIMLITAYILVSLGVQKVSVKMYIYLLSVLILLPVIFAPAILGSLLIILISYHYGHRTGFWSGMLAFIYFVSRYYYDLEFTLLVKSEIMLASGALFLLAFFILKPHLRSHEN